MDMLIFLLNYILELKYDSFPRTLDYRLGKPALSVDFHKIPLPKNASGVEVQLLDYEYFTKDTVIGFNDRISFIKDGELLTLQLPRISQTELFEYRFSYYRNEPYLLLWVYPMQYDPESKKLRVYTKVELKINIVEGASEQAYLPDSIDYLILSPSMFREVAESLKLLAVINGFRTYVEYIDSIRLNPYAIRELIKRRYKEWGIRYASILGDGIIVPPFRFTVNYYPNFLLPSGPDIYTDFPFSALDGDMLVGDDPLVGDETDSIDVIPDIYFSRIPISSVQEGLEYYRKLRNYIFNYQGASNTISCLESRIVPDAFSWLCENAMGPYSIAKQKLYQEYFPDGLTPQIVMDSLNTLKPHLFAYIGHSNSYAIATNYVPTYTMESWHVRYFLNNTYAPFIGYIGGCWVADITVPSFAVDLVRMPQVGAVFIMGSSKLDFATGEQTKVFLMLNSIYNDSVKTTGEIIHDLHTYLSASRYMLYSFNAFGDPTIKLFTEGRNTLNANVYQSGEYLIVQTLDSSTVIIYDGETYLKAMTDASGFLSLRLPYDVPKELLVSVNKDGYLPYYTYVIYTPEGIVLDSIYHEPERLLKGSEATVFVKLGNLSAEGKLVHFRVSLTNALPKIYEEVVYIPSGAYRTISFNMVPTSDLSVGLNFYVDGSKVKGITLPVGSVKPMLTGIVWNGSIASLGIYNPSEMHLESLQVAVDGTVLAYVDVPPGEEIRRSVSIYKDTFTLELRYGNFQRLYRIVKTFQPSPPANIILEPKSEGILIHFNDSAGYFKIYRRKPGGKFKLVGITTHRIFLDTTVGEFALYEYVFTKLDSFFNESQASSIYVQAPNPTRGTVNLIGIYSSNWSNVVSGNFTDQSEGNELFACSKGICIFVSERGEVLKAYEIPIHTVSKFPVGDLDGDGIDEVVISGFSLMDSKANLLIMDMHSLDTLFVSPNISDIAYHEMGIALGDFDGDLDKEIVLKGFGNSTGDTLYNPRLIFVEPSTGSYSVVRLNNSGTDMNGFAIGDVDRDGRDEVVMVYYDRSLHAFRMDGSEAPGFPVDISNLINNEDIVSSFTAGYDTFVVSWIQTTANRYITIFSTRGNYVSSFQTDLYTKPFALVDIDADMLPEIVLSGDSIAIYDIYGNQLTNRVSDAVLGAWNHSSPIVADIFSDGKLNIIVNIPRGINAYRIEGDTLVQEYGFPIIFADDTIDGRPNNSPAFYKLAGIYQLVSLFNMTGIHSFLVNADRIYWKEALYDASNSNWASSKQVVSDREDALDEPLILFVPKKRLLNINYDGDFKLDIYDLSGRKVRSIRSEGKVSIRLNLPSGIYVLHISAHELDLKRKLVLPR